MIKWAESTSTRNQNRLNDEMMQHKAAQHVGTRAMGKWRSRLVPGASRRAYADERAQVFCLTKQLGAMHTSQMTAAVLTWKQPVVRQRDADMANLRSRLDIHIGVSDEALRNNLKQARSTTHKRAVSNAAGAGSRYKQGMIPTENLKFQRFIDLIYQSKMDN